jgi:hypothetical protein
MWGLGGRYQHFEGKYCLLLSPEDGSGMLFQNAGMYLQAHNPLLPRRPKVQNESCICFADLSLHSISRHYIE